MQRLLIVWIWFATANLLGQDCHCDITLPNLSENSFNTIDKNSIDYNPGDVICIPKGQYAGIAFVGIQGTENEYITITNCGGQVLFSEPTKSAISFRFSNHIRLTGTGSAESKYGIKVQAAPGAGAAGINIGSFSSDFEIDFIEIQHTGFAGIVGETDPKCDEPDTWRRNGYVLQNLNIHHNYIHYTGGEGIYLGYTGGYKVSSNVSCDGEFVFGHWLENIKVHHNRLENIGWDGQLSLTRKFGSVHDNLIKSYGLQNEVFQNFAMSIGGGTYDIYNNTIINSDEGYGQGIQLISAKSNSKIFNNVIVKPDFHGIFIHNRHQFDNENSGYLIANNTIVNPGDSGIFYNTAITESEELNLIGAEQATVPTYFINNLIIDPGSQHEVQDNWKGYRENFIDFNDIRSRDLSRGRIATNLFTRKADTLCLASVEENDFRPAFNRSPLVDSGSNLSFEGVVFDRNNEHRPQNQRFDIGAFEFEGTILNFECVGFNNDILNGSNLYGRNPTAYPNPAKDYVRFTSPMYKAAKLNVYSLQGKLVLTETYEFGKELYVGNLARGFYYASFNVDNKQQIVKIWIEYHKK